MMASTCWSGYAPNTDQKFRDPSMKDFYIAVLLRLADIIESYGYNARLRHERRGDRINTRAYRHAARIDRYVNTLNSGTCRLPEKDTAMIEPHKCDECGDTPAQPQNVTLQRVARRASPR
jgi:hypothetical protein